MKNKGHLIIVLLTIFLVFSLISVVSASDQNDTVENNVTHNTDMSLKKEDYRIAGTYTHFSSNVSVYNNTVNTGRVSYSLNKKWIGSSYIKNETSTLKYMIPSNYNGTYTLKATYINSSNVSIASQNFSVYITPKTNFVSIVNKKNFEVNSNVTFDSSVKSYIGTYLSNGRVSYTFNNTWIGSVNVTSGNASLDYTLPSTSGSYVLNVTYYNQNNVITATNHTIININGYKTSLTIDTPKKVEKSKELSLRAYVRFSDVSKHETINNGHVVFYLNGKEIASKSIYHGKAIVSYTPKIRSGTYVMSAKYVSSDSYVRNAYNKKNITVTLKKVNSTDSTIRGNKNPLTDNVPLLANNTPNLVLMSNYIWAKEDNTYTLTKSQYMEVYNRDSYTLFLNKKLSKYVAFRTKYDPHTYRVISREKWNVIERAINTNLVLSNGKPWPEQISVNLSNKSYTYSEVRDRQNTGYTCGPTSLSMCSQVLRHYQSEARFTSVAGTTSRYGTAPAGLKTAVSKYNMTATLYNKNSFNYALNQLAQGGCAVVFHTFNHYVALMDISKDKTKVLVGNPSGSYEYGSHGIPTKWLSVSYMKTRFNTQNTYGVVVKLNYNLNSTTKNNVNKFYKNMAPGWTRSDTNSTIADLGI